MATRIKDGEIPYTGGTGIEITANHVINVLLRDENNLIQVNDDRELYVDLQLVDGIEPDDDFPVGVTTGKILEEDGRPQSGIILNWKTTSGDYNRWIYANDEKLYFDPGTGEWLHILTESEIMELLEQIEAQIVNNGKLTIMENGVIKGEFYANQAGDTLVQLQGGSGTGSNTQTFFFTDPLSVAVAQTAYDWYKAGNEPILNYDDGLGSNNAYFLQTIDPNTNTYYFKSTREFIRNRPNKGYSELVASRIIITVDPLTDQVISVTRDEAVILDGVITKRGYNNAYMPQQDSDPVSKKYVDDLIGGVTYTAGDGINIDQNNVISNTGVLTINNNNPDADGNIDVNEVPNGGTEGQVLKKTQNGYEWGTDNDTTYTAGHGINIDQNNEISNTLGFEPQPGGSEGQVLKLGPNGTYGWQNESGGGGGGGNTYYGGTAISIDSSNYINNTKPFDPSNAGSEGQVLKKTQNGYQWSNESGGGSYTAGSGINITSNNVIENTKQFNPDNLGSAGQVLVKTQNGYDWQSISVSQNVKLFTINSSTSTSPNLSILQDALDWYNAGNLPILKAYKSDWGRGAGYKFFMPDIITNHTDTQTGDTWQELDFFAIYDDDDFVKDNTNGYTTLYIPIVDVKIVSGDVDSANIRAERSLWSDFISPSTSYTNAYNPQYDSSPATKKYVDDHDTVVSGDNGVTYTIKVSNSDPAAGTPNNVITLVL